MRFYVLTMFPAAPEPGVDCVIASGSHREVRRVRDHRLAPAPAGLVAAHGDAVRRTPRGRRQPTCS